MHFADTKICTLLIQHIYNLLMGTLFELNKVRDKEATTGLGRLGLDK